MQPTSSVPPAGYLKHDDGRRISRRQLVFSLIYPFAYPALIFLLGGDIHWSEAWIFSLWFLTLYFAVFTFLWYKEPSLLAERFRMPGSDVDQPWDKRLIYPAGMLYLAWILLVPLDARRFHWSGDFPFIMQSFGWVMLVLCFLLVYQTYTENPFLSALVRIQRERGQYLVATGIYSFVRHPLYLGADLMIIGTPLLLGSWYGLIPAVLLVALIVVRLIGEERMLVADLEGYAEYRKKVKYRLVPFIW